MIIEQMNMNSNNSYKNGKRWLMVAVLSFIIFHLSFSHAVAQTKADSATIVSLLSEASHQPRTTCFPLFFARHFLGRPYVANTLETADGEERLMVNTRQLDCTTLVENVAALTLCAYRNLYTFRDYLNALVQLRYRQGRLKGYESRLHYFSDWIDDNTQLELVSEVQSDEPPFTSIQTLDINYMSTHPKAYSALRLKPELISIIRQQEEALTGRKYRFIPKTAMDDNQVLKKAVADGDIIAITCNKPGLDIAHVGIAVWHDDGLHLLNASQLHKKVVEEPMTLSQYLAKHPSHTGIRVVRMRK